MGALRAGFEAAPQKPLRNSDGEAHGAGVGRGVSTAILFSFAPTFHNNSVYYNSIPAIENKIVPLIGIDTPPSRLPDPLP